MRSSASAERDAASFPPRRRFTISHPRCRFLGDHNSFAPVRVVNCSPLIKFRSRGAKTLSSEEWGVELCVETDFSSTFPQARFMVQNKEYFESGVLTGEKPSTLSDLRCQNKVWMTPSLDPGCCCWNRRSPRANAGWLQEFNNFVGTCPQTFSCAEHFPLQNFFPERQFLKPDIDQHFERHLFRGFVLMAEGWRSSADH